MQQLSSLMNMQSKNVLVLGGSGYLGSAASQVYAELGANVIISSRNLSNCRNVVDSLMNEIDQSHNAVACDILSNNSIMNLRNEIVKNYGKLDVLVISAWTGRKNSWNSISEKDWRFDIDICLNSHFSIVKIFEPIIRDGGKIIMVSSMYGHVSPTPKLYENVPQENPPSYGVAKAGVIQFTKYLCNWLQDRKINVNCISPGPFPFPEVIAEHSEFCERLKKMNPSNTLGIPEDLKGIFAILGTDSSRFINGQNICVDGGWATW